MKPSSRIWVLACVLLLSQAIAAPGEPESFDPTACGGVVLDPLVAPAVSPRAIVFRHKAWEPRVIDPLVTTQATLRVVVLGAPTSVELVPRAGGANLPLTPVGADTFEITLPLTSLLFGHLATDHHNLVGFLDVFQGTTRVLRVGAFVNVRIPAIPSVTVVPLAADAQVSPHVVNIRRDAPWFSTVPVDAVQRFYQMFDDDADFVALVGNVEPALNRTYNSVRNSTQGIGIPPIDSGATWGSAAALQGVIAFPIDSLFDLAEPAASHEIGHRWINQLDEQAQLALGAPHYPLSDLAYSLMGYGTPGGQGLTFPWNLTAQPSGDYLVQFVPAATQFHDLDLYLMGLAGEQEVGPHFVFQNQSQTPANGGTLFGPVTFLDAGDVIAAVGPRVPDVATSQKEFRIVAIVLSAGRLLTETEMAFYDAMSARGAATTELFYSSGGASGMAKPFYLATAGRATLETTACRGTAVLDTIGNPCAVDDDGDGSLDAADCAPSDATTYPGAAETNDALDNQCDGEPGAGLVDETSGNSGFLTAGDKERYSWPGQAGATQYQIARSAAPTFPSGCSVLLSSDAFWVDVELPPTGEAFYYLNRPFAPHVGSWGADSAGAERTGICPGS